MKNFLLLVFLLSFNFLQSQTLTTQGVLRGSDNKAVNDGAYNLKFLIYTDSTGGSEVWSEEYLNYQITNGVYSVNLGSKSTLSSLDFSRAYWVEIEINSTKLSPRTPLTMSVYLMAPLDASNVMPSAGPVGIGTRTPSNTLTIVDNKTTTNTGLHIKNTGAYDARLKLSSERTTNAVWSIGTGSTGATSTFSNEDLYFWKEVGTPGFKASITQNGSLITNAVTSLNGTWHHGLYSSNNNNNKVRFAIGLSGTEGLGNTGSNFFIRRYKENGDTLTANPVLEISRSNGDVTIRSNFQSTGDVNTNGKYKQSGNELLPKGSIIMWSGLPTALPSGWLLCNGANGTPDLQGRFVVGYQNTQQDYNTVGKKGGSNSVTLTVANLAPHSHQFGIDWWDGNLANTGGVDSNTNSGSNDVSATTRSTGSGTPFDNRPPYYVLCFLYKNF